MSRIEINFNFILFCGEARSIFYFHVNSILTLNKINAKKKTANAFKMKHFAASSADKRLKEESSMISTH